MDSHIKEYYRKSSGDSPQGSPGNFHSIISLNDSPDATWKAISSKVPQLSRGWFELSHLEPKDRIEFTHDFWMSRLPYNARVEPVFDKFFSSLDDIVVFLTQKKFDDPFESTLVYSLKDDSGFFKGSLPISEKNLNQLERCFSNFILPEDYLAFLHIHDGFSKATDSTGLTSSVLMPETYRNFQKMLKEEDPIILTNGAVLNPATLIPFYESFGMPFYQCFWGEWYPEQEMGNVYYSGNTKTISDVYTAQLGSESMAFSTFIDWLAFYLEGIENV